MTVLLTHCKVSYEGDDVTTAFPTTFRFLEAEHLVVELSDDDGETWDDLTMGVDYEVSGANAAEPGGTVTLTGHGVLADGEKLRIKRRTPITQPTAFGTFTKFTAATHELAQDRRCMVEQEIVDRLEDVEALNGTVAVEELGDAALLNDQIVTGDVVSASFPIVVAVADGQNALVGAWRVDKVGAPTVPNAEPPQVQWIPGPANDQITIINVSGLEPNSTYFYTGLIFRP